MFPKRDDVAWFNRLVGEQDDAADEIADDLLHAEADTGWELWGRRAYRKGRWKAVLIPPPQGTGAWELYDVVADPSEKANLAKQNPRQLAVLVRAWDRYAKDNGVVEGTIPGI